MFQKGERVADVQFAQYQGTESLKMFVFIPNVFNIFEQYTFFAFTDGKAVKIGKYRAVTDELEFTSPVQFHGNNIQY